MIATNLNENNVGYKQMENNKVECDRCGSIVSKSSFKRHLTTKKCLGEGNMVVKTADRNVRMRTNTNNLRSKKISELGIDEVRRIEREKKQKQRADRKAGKPARERKEVKTENNHDEVLNELNIASADIKKISNKKDRLKLTDVINQARRQIATGEKTLPEVKKIINQKIQKINDDDAKVNNCKELTDRLDSKNLRNPNAHHKIERKTLEGYIRAIERIYKGMSGENFDCSDFTWLNNHESVSNYIENLKVEIGTKRNYFNAIYSVLRRLEGYSHLTTVYNKMKTKYGDMVDENRGKNKLTEKEMKNILPWTTIVNYNNKKWTEEARLLFKLYTAMPPRRLKDYSLLKYIKGKSVPAVQKMDKQFNYIVVNKNKNPIALIINNYKTKKRYGTFIVDLNKPDLKPHFRFSEIRKAIKDFARATDINSGELVFPNSQGGIYRDFTVWVHYLFKGTGKKIGVNLLRHSFISNFLGKNPNASDNTVKKMAQAMGHKPETFRSYRKLDAPVQYESDSE